MTPRQHKESEELQAKKAQEAAEAWHTPYPLLTQGYLLLGEN